MEHKLSKHICNYLLSTKIINEEYIEVYIYGTELLLSFLISTSVILTIGLITNRFINTIVFLTVFTLLRRFTGGFHANTYLMCKLFTIGTYLIVLFVSEKITITFVPFLVLSLIGLIVICLWGPIEHPNKPITDFNKKRFKTISLLLYSILSLIGIGINNIAETLSSVVCYTLASVIALMILSILKKGTSKNEETSG